MSEPDFADLVKRIRKGDQDAATELVQLYEPLIRRSIRFRLSNGNLRSTLDSMDICQSVLGSFFVRAASGGYDLNQPEDLQKLLTAMARNKLKVQARKQQTQRRDRRRVDAGADIQALASADGTASRQLAARELLDEVHKRLSPEERRLVEWRGQGLEWQAIAKQVNGSPEALRKQLARALDRVAEELGLDEGDHA